jgi:hypothetical protein
LEHALFEACLVMCQSALALTGPDTWNRGPCARCRRDAFFPRQHPKSVRAKRSINLQTGKCVAISAACKTSPHDPSL